DPTFPTTCNRHGTRPVAEMWGGARPRSGAALVCFSQSRHVALAWASFHSWPGNNGTNTATFVAASPLLRKGRSCLVVVCTSIENNFGVRKAYEHLGNLSGGKPDRLCTAQCCRPEYYPHRFPHVAWRIDL